MTDSKCYAAIDIGSNAVRLLIKKVKNNENLANKRLSKVMLLRVPLRLGFDVFSLGEVSDAKVMKLRRLMKDMYIPNSFTTPKYLLWNNYFKSSIAWYHASGWAETESIWGN